MSSVIRYGLIGTGQNGRGHLGCIKERDGVRLVAAADTNDESMAAFQEENPESSTKCVTDYHEVLAMDEVDAVVIATPGHLHVQMTIDALAAGKHVLSEKPAATTREDLDRLETAVRNAGTIYQIGLECRYLPIFAKMKAMIDEGRVGKPQMLWCKEFRGPFLKKTDDWILSRERSGGTLVEKMCHYFDLLTWFAGSRPARVACFGGQDVEKGKAEVHDILDNAWVMIEYESGARAGVGVCMFAPRGPAIEMGVIGQNGRIDGSEFFREHAATYYAFDGDEAEKIVAKPEGSNSNHGGAVMLEHLAFENSIRANDEPLTNFAVARDSVLVGLAAEESAARHGAVVEIC